jgi:hypothetical protein
VAIKVKLDNDLLYTSAIPPDFEGKVNQSVNIPLSSASEGRTLTVIAWRSDRGAPDCGQIRGSGPSCMTIVVDSSTSR